MTKQTRSGAASTKTAKDIRRQILDVYPFVYFIPNVGWCGPEWQAARELEKRLTE